MKSRAPVLRSSTTEFSSASVDSDGVMLTKIKIVIRKRDPLKYFDILSSSISKVSSFCKVRENTEQNVR